MIAVVDASVVVDVLLNRPRASTAIELLSGPTEAYAPQLLLAEVLHALRSVRLRGELTRAEAHEAVTLLLELPIELQDMRPLAAETWSLTGSLTAYDATYVALARTLGAPLLTFDDRLARGAARHVEVLT